MNGQVAVSMSTLVMQVIIERLEGEGAEARQSATEEAAKREAALKGQFQSALQAAQESVQKHADRCCQQSCC